MTELNRLNITAAQESMLKEYLSQLCQANGRVRLTGSSDPTVLWQEHVTDCLYLASAVEGTEKIIDVGTGGGLPGVVLAVCFPKSHVTLLDSQKKKAVQLGKIVEALELENVSVISARSEELAAARREEWDCAVARAVCEAPVLAEYLSPLVRQGGCLLAMKGPAWEEEVLPVQGKWSALGLSEPRALPYQLGESARVILRWDKVAAIDKKYPRRPGRAEKIGWWKNA
ncbi:16S rRNA (guanine(527)-N(7))-methyltransferase GidB [Jonquetella anthropi DSM 22815]|uniref:Ribosomal RNA small subunit methyltransferase G n=1 Tax=Jonquetella anthropi DSM 22815 TaxID=885272 RepID=H0UJG4_9BACT|nr:16S rRNA (guanine(527)-N(7))-methyltransferase RsmG [Jonquetella anthropi]EHM13931.1 16S rRNA (guanine(527)-N(7))-methyltransferase GidB [Jonquetella anthropi DSM 22815]